MVGEIVLLLADILFTSTVLFLAGKVTSVEIEPKEILIVSLIAVLLTLVPLVGMILSILALFFLLKRFTDAPIWPDLLLMVVVSKLFSFLILAGVLNVFS